MDFTKMYSNKGHINICGREKGMIGHILKACKNLMLIIMVFFLFFFLVAGKFAIIIWISVQLSHSVMTNFSWSHGPEHGRPPCPSPTPRDYSNSSPLSQWCHPTISSLVIPLSSCLQSFPASRSFQMSQLFASGGQSIGVSASASVLPMNTQDWSL